MAYSFSGVFSCLRALALRWQGGPRTIAALGLGLTLIIAAAIIIGESWSPGATEQVVSVFGWQWRAPKRFGFIEYHHALALTEVVTLLGLGLRWSWRASSHPGRDRLTAGLLVACLVVAGSLATARNALLRPQAFDVRDDFHYLLGTKYFDELGYDGLYECVMTSEIGRGRNRVKWVRDLATNHTFHAKDIAEDPARQQRCIDRFSQARWQEFRADVAAFRAWLEPWGNQWPRMMADHGYNGPPLLTAVLSAIGNAVPIDHESLSQLGLINLGAVGVMLAAAMWAFGWEAAVVFGVVFFTSAVEGFGHAMSIPRYLWLSTLIVGMAAMQRQRWGLAAAALVVSTFLKIFPVFFLAAASWYVVVLAVRRGHLRELRTWPPARFFVAGIMTTAVLMTLTLTWHGGIDGWQGFFDQMRINGNRKAGGCIGFVFNFTYSTTNPDFDAMVAPLTVKVFGVRVQVIAWVIGGLLVAALARHAGRLSPGACTILVGFALMHVYAVPMRYYYAGYLGLALLFATGRHAAAWWVFASFLLVLDVLAKVVGVHTREVFVTTGLVSSGLTAYLVAVLGYLEHVRSSDQRGLDESS